MSESPNSCKLYAILAAAFALLAWVAVWLVLLRPNRFQEMQQPDFNGCAASDCK